MSKVAVAGRKQKQRPRSTPTDYWEDEADRLARWLAKANGELAILGVTAVPAAHFTGVGGNAHTAAQLATITNSLGKQLPKPLREQFEYKLGTDLSHIRLHLGESAQQFTGRRGMLGLSSGRDILLAQSHVDIDKPEDRQLLAHEVVHSLQQQESAGLQMQPWFERSQEDNDEIIKKLVELHVTNARRVDNSVAQKLKDPTHWFQEMRAQLEPREPREEGKTLTINSESLATQIYTDVIRDHKGQFPEQNAVLAVIADYFRMNGAMEVAARLAMLAPYLRTAALFPEVKTEMSKHADLMRKYLPKVFDLVWANSGYEGSWQEPIVDLISEFLSLSPIPANQKRREAIAKEMQIAELPFQHRIEIGAGADPYYQILGAKEPTPSELWSFAGDAIYYQRKTFSLEMHASNNAIRPDGSPESLIKRWSTDAAVFANYLSQIGAEENSTIDRIQGDYAGAYKVSVDEFQKLLKPALEPVLEPHIVKWTRFSEALKPNDALQGQLSAAFRADDSDMLKKMESLAKHIADGHEAYASLPKAWVNEEHRDLYGSFDAHREKAKAYASHLINYVQTPLVEWYQKALDSVDEAAIEKLELFNAQLDLVIAALHEVGDAPLDSHDALQLHAIRRRQIAGRLGDLARAALFEPAGRSHQQQQAGEPVAQATKKPSQKPGGAKKEPSIPKTEEVVEAELKNVQNVPGKAHWRRIMNQNYKIARNEYIKSGLLFLTQKFEPAKSSRPRKMLSDASGYSKAVIKGLEPFRVGDVVDFFELQYDDRLANKLSELNDKSENASGAARGMKDLWLSTKASKSLKRDAKKGRLPRRYESKDPIWFGYHGEKPGAFKGLVEMNPYYQQWRNTRSVESEQDYIPLMPIDRSPFENKDVWLWSIPIPRELIGILFDVPLLRGLVALGEPQFDSYANQLIADVESLTPLPKDADEDERKAHRDAKHKASSATYDALVTDALLAAEASGDSLPIDIFTWYQVLQHRASVIKDATDRFPLMDSTSISQRDQQASQIKTQRVQKERAVDLALRKAQTNDRAVVRAEMRSLLNEYLKEGIRAYGSLSRAMGLFAYFERNVEPVFVDDDATRRERRLQTAALTIEVFDLLEDAFEHDRPLKDQVDDAYFYIKRAQDSFDELLLTPSNSIEDDPVESHAEGILNPEQRELLSSKEDRKNLTSRMDAILSKHEDELAELQWKFRLVGDKSSQKFRTGVMKGSEVLAHDKVQKINEKNPDDDPKDDFIQLPGGMRIRLHRISKDFTYLPAMGDKLRASSPTDSQYARHKKAQIYVGKAAKSRSDLEGVSPSTEEDPVSRTARVSGSEHHLITVTAQLGAEKEFSKPDIWSDDIEGMQWVSDMVTDKSIQQSFQNTADVIELFGEVGLFIASLHPLVGAILTGVEMARFAALIMNDQTFRDQLAAVIDDPAEIITGTLNRLEEQFKMENLFDALLNGNFDAPHFGRSVTSKDRKALGKRRVGRLFARMKRVVFVAGMKLERFQNRVQRPLRVVQGAMAEHPRMSTMTQWAAGNVGKIGSDPMNLVLQHPVAGPIYETYMLYRMHGDGAEGYNVLRQPMEQVGKNVSLGLEEMQNFSLPDEVIPLELLLNAVIELLLILVKKAGGRYGKVAAALGRVLREGLQSSGLWQPMLKMVAQVLGRSVVDPNVYWRLYAKLKLEGKLQSTLREAGESIEGALQEVPILGNVLGAADEFSNAKHPVGPTSKIEKPTSASVTLSSDDNALFDSEAARNAVPDTDQEEVPVAIIPFDVMRRLPKVFFDKIEPAEKPADGSKPTLMTDEGMKPDNEWSVAEANAENQKLLEDQEAGRAPPSHFPPEGPKEMSPAPLTSSAGPTAGPTSGTSRGSRLAPDLRNRTERQFGHSLNHVRFHQNPQADFMTRSLGADALTSGRHIFMRSGLSPRGGTGANVFRHEVAHVLQKTTSPDSPATKAPAKRLASGSGTTRSGGTLRLRRHEEQAADRMADRARTNRSGRPVPIEGRHDGGMSPALKSELIETFLRKISSPAGAASLATRVDKAHKRHDSDADKSVKQTANDIWTKVRPILLGQGLKADDRFDGSLTDIRGHLRARLGTLEETKQGTPPTAQSQTPRSVPSVGRVIEHLAERRQAEKKNGNSGAASGSGNQKKPQQELDVDGFLLDLSLYIAARSGVVVDLKRRKGDAKLSGRLPANFRVSAEVQHIELHFMTDLTKSGNRLWAKAIQSTWKDAKKIDHYKRAVKTVLRDKFDGDPPAVTHSGSGSGKQDEDNDTNKQLASGGFQPIWKARAELTFNSRFKAEVEAEMNPPDVSYSQMPPWPLYVGKSENSANSRNSRLGDRGATSINTLQKKLPSTVKDQRTAAKSAIHFAKHSDATLFSLQQTGRNSHHIVQYLLAEYFANRKGFKPFANHQANIASRAGGGTIKVGKTAGSESSRGGAMPAIIISAKAHQNADLHVTPQSDEGGSLSQGFAIHHFYEEKLKGDKYKDDTLEDARKKIAAIPGDDSEFKAVQATAKWIWKEQMRPNLRTNFPKQEASFYMKQFLNVKDDEKDAAEKQLEDLHGGTKPNQGDIEKALRNDVVGSAETFAAESLKEHGWEIE